MRASATTTLRTQLLERLALAWRSARPHYRSQLVLKIGSLFDRFLDERLSDPTFSSQIANGQNYVHEQRMAELLLADYLWTCGFDLSSAPE